MNVIYVTGNKAKFDIAKSVLENSGIELIQDNSDIPEIQSIQVSDVAKYSVMLEGERVKKPVVVTDAGFYINALNGFPGPFIKYINKWLCVEDIINLLKDKEDRSIYIKDCLAYNSGDGQIKVFEHEIRGIITKEVKSEKGSIIEQLVIPDSLGCTLAELTYEQSIEFWSKNSNFVQFREWIKNNG